MIRLSLSLVLLLCCSCSLVRTSIEPQVEPALDAPLTRFDHGEFDRVLERFVDDQGSVDYQALVEDSEDLERYYAKFAAYSPDSHPELFPTEDARLAYWINAYNASAMVVVLRYYPIESVSAVKEPLLLRWLPANSGFFVFQGLSYGGVETSLYYLEHDVIRDRFQDARIHFALNCASLGCPRLPRRTFSPETLDADLDRETRLFCSEERNFRIDDERRVIVLSSIFDWYEDDFIRDHRRRTGREDAELLDAVGEYLEPAKRERLQQVRDEYDVEFAPYDWGLNDTARHGRTESTP